MIAKLGPQERRESIEAMRNSTFDVVVVGGGVTGSGVALDAASRGLSVALVEARDFASGTSSRSSKLIHGGLRYLELLDFMLVKEALYERGLLTHVLAPHLVQPLPFLLPLRHRYWERAYVGAGLVLYDLLARIGKSPRLPWHSHLSKTKAQELWPDLNPMSYVGALQYYDAQVDDARHTLTVARTAAAFGARLLTRARVTDLMRSGDRVTGVRVATDELPDEPFDLHARVVINASGVWSNDVEALAAGVERQLQDVAVRASKGIHLVVPRDRIDAQTGLIARTEKSVLFVIPWGHHWIIGTTDTDWSHDKVHPAASKRDIDYVLGHVNRLVREPITREDIQGVYVGLRPLVAKKDASTAKLSREHAVSTPVPGLVGVTGGKYTTYRVMAKDVVDVALQYVDASAKRPSRTHEIPLLGANGFRQLDAAQLAQRYGLSVEQTSRLLYRYGSLVEDVLAPTTERPELLQPLPDTDEYVAAEALYAVTSEGALHVEDVLTRRTRISVQTWSRGVDAAETVAGLMQEVLGWSDARRQAEVAHYTRRVAAERASNDADDDADADRLRREAGDIAAIVRGL